MDSSEYEAGIKKAGTAMTQTAETSKKTLNQLRSDAGKLAQEYMKAGQTQSEAMKRAYAELKNTGQYETSMRKLADSMEDLGKAADNTADKVEDYGKEAKDAGNKAKDAAEKPKRSWLDFGKTVSGVGDKFGTVSAKAVAAGTMIAHALEKAANAAVNLGKSAINAAAEVSAENAQFTASFGELQGSAEKAFDRVSKSTGIFSTRLRTVGTKAFSQFKGAGLDAVDALGSMEQYTNLAADAAAYYDISLEEADEKLRSFLRGNTEAGDAIGLFTSESQRNTYAMEKYGAKWTELTEAQKQMLMLDVAQDIYEQSGAIGQAARESDNWTNVMGNLKEGWRQALAVVGAPIVEAITPIIQKITDFLGDNQLQLRLDQFGLTIGTIANSTFTAVEGFIDKLTTEGTGENNLIDGIATFADGLIKLGSATLDSAIGFVTGFANLLGIEGSSDFFSNAGSFFSDLGTFAADHSEAIGAVITAILALMAVQNPFAALMAALVVIVGNWEDIKEFSSDALDKFRDFINTHVPEGFLSGAIDAWNTILGIIQTALSAAQAFIDSLSSASAAAGSAAIQSGYESGGVSGAASAAWDNAWWNPSNWGKGHAVGLDYVPYNDYPARLHEGEAVLTKAEATEWRSGASSQTIDYASVGNAVAEAVQSALNGAFVDMDGEHVGRLVTKSVSRGIAAGAHSRRYASV